MNRRLRLAAALLLLVIGIAACRPAEGGAGGTPSPEPSIAVESNGAPAEPTDAPDETPIATMGSDYGY
jgi:hypothetical protein